MIGFDIVKRRGEYDPDPEATKRVTANALANGLVLLSCGVHGNAIRILVPLTVPEDVLEQGMQRLELALIAARA